MALPLGMGSRSASSPYKMGCSRCKERFPSRLLAKTNDYRDENDLLHRKATEPPLQRGVN